MNNDAFKDLVRSKVKSTKEIAREAVEEAFHEKKKKRKRKGRSDDDDLSSSESESESRPKKYRDDQLQPTSIRKKGRNNKGDGEGGESHQYRDRAKERREGKNLDYEESQKMLETVAQLDGDTSLDQADVSKYLGGDEAHTHLVKGLDVALARSVRSEMTSKGKEGDDDMEELEEEEDPTISTVEQAWEFMESDASTSHSTLGRSMLTFLREKRKRMKAQAIECSGAGSAIQRTQLSFSSDWHPQNLALSWEVPIEKSQAAVMATHATRLPKASPLPSDLIHQIIHSQRKFKDLGFVGLRGPATGGNSIVKTLEESEDSEDDIFPDAGD